MNDMLIILKQGKENIDKKINKLKKELISTTKSSERK